MKLKELILSTQEFRDYIYKSGKVIGLKFRYIPKSKQLYIYSYVHSGTDSSKRYKVLLVFNQINCSEERSGKFSMKLSQPSVLDDKEMVTYYLTRPTFNNNILVRCSCPSFRHEFHWHDAKYKALIGPKIPYTRVPGSNRPPKNPHEIPGICKHLIQLVLKLMAVGVLNDRDGRVTSYITKPRRLIN